MYLLYLHNSCAKLNLYLEFLKFLDKNNRGLFKLQFSVQMYKLTTKFFGENEKKIFKW